MCAHGSLLVLEFYLIALKFFSLQPKGTAAEMAMLKRIGALVRVIFMRVVCLCSLVWLHLTMDTLLDGNHAFMMVVIS